MCQPAKSGKPVDFLLGSFYFKQLKNRNFYQVWVRILAELSLAYGKGFVNLQLPSRQILDILQPGVLQSEPLPAEARIEKELDAALASLQDSPAILQNKQTVLVVPDRTRNCGASLILPALVRRLQDLGVQDSEIEIIVANGAHRANEPEEIASIVGAEMVRRFRIVQHGCRHTPGLRFLGETRFGTPVSLNAHILDAEQVVVVGTAVHHYFAGFGGGPKMINPGCAAYETITKNHALTIDVQTANLHPLCRPGVLEGNPVQEDIKDAMKFVDVDLLIETVLAPKGEIAAVFCGELYPAHRNACLCVDAMYRIEIQEHADLVVASCGGFPKDINLIQSHKTIYNAFQAVKPGGVLLVLAECSQGIGSPTFLEWFDYPGARAMADELVQSYKLNGTTALSLRTKAETVRIVLVSQLKAELVTKLGILPASHLEDGWRQSMSFLPEEFRCYVIPNASVTHPVLSTG